MRTDQSCSASSRKWIVVNTQPHREHIAVDHLSRQEFRAYCPLLRKTISHARRKHDVLRPLFPSYLFVQLDPHISRWRPILSTEGVRTVVRCGEQPSFVQDGFIESLKARETDGVIVPPEATYRVGQQVRIAMGAFDGSVATIIEMDERDRIVVLMNMLNRSVRVRLFSRQVTAA